LTNQNLCVIKVYETKPMLTYKCNWFGRTLVEINRFFPSSKTCSCCGSIYKELGRNESEWTCKSCGVTLDMDVNADVNILEQGNLYISGESPDYSRGGVSVDKLARVKAQPRRNDESTINFYG
jgi:transposase